MQMNKIPFDIPPFNTYICSIRLKKKYYEEGIFNYYIIICF